MMDPLDDVYIWVDVHVCTEFHTTQGLYEDLCEPSVKNQ